jgi:protein-disulfide isomerase
MKILKPAISDKDHVEGNANATIELVEYGDYQCPHCGRAYPVVKNIQKKMGDKLKFVFRNFPLSEMHPDALHAAVASEAAGAQNKFWQMHDMLFENQNDLSDEALINYASEIKLDIEKFKTDFETPAFTEKVESDFESGMRSGVNGTPSFFINGKKYNGDWEENYLLEYLEKL